MADQEYLKAERMMDAKRALFRGTENLMELGGFISEVVENKILTLYPSAVSQAARKYCRVGPGFWEVAGAVNDVFIRYDSYNDMQDYYSEEEFENEFFNGDSEECFFKWLMDQTARCAYEKLKEKGDIWGNVKLPIDKIGIQTAMSPLDERIIDLNFGLSKNEKMKVEEIAQLPEFKCNPYYIMSVRDYAKKVFARFVLSDDDILNGIDNSINKDN